MEHTSTKKVLELAPKTNKKTKEATDPLQKFKNIVEKKFSKFKEELKKLREQFKSEKKNSLKELSTLKKEIDSFKKDTLSLLENLSAFAGSSPTEIRQEIINGIRMVGDRVSVAIQELNVRIDDLSKQVDKKIEALTIDEIKDQQTENPFGSLKEGELVELNAFEVVPREAIETLTQLFKHQTTAVNSFIKKQEQRMHKLELKLETYDEENTRLFELLNRRVERNFRFFIYAVVIILILIFLIRFI